MPIRIVTSFVLAKDGWIRFWKVRDRAIICLMIRNKGLRGHRVCILFRLVLIILLCLILSCRFSFILVRLGRLFIFFTFFAICFI
jgi:hypothetical protein